MSTVRGHLASSAAAANLYCLPRCPQPIALTRRSHTHLHAYQTSHHYVYTYTKSYISHLQVYKTDKERLDGRTHFKLIFVPRHLPRPPITIIARHPLFFVRVGTAGRQ